ncbi:MAG: hypothetical protein ACD_15C00063G0006 [uncultured bacterium]|nr:MAG: hypothetical protein ACD_15C00063G0006 [uncultured bacterium]
MIFNIPQFIDIEDKIVGPLTAKQLGWLAAGGVCLLLLWSVLDLAAFVVSTFFVAFIFVGLAFYRPNGQPLISALGSIFIFFSKPKIYMWRRMPDTKNLFKHTKIINEKSSVHTNKEISLEEIKKVSQLLEIKKK